MKWRENIWMKALAFIAAVAAFTATAIMGWYQLANLDAIWDDSYWGWNSYTLSYLMSQDCSSIRYLVDLKEQEARGEELVWAAKQDLALLETQFSPANTNLRWQLLDGDGRVVYGNSAADSSKLYTALYGYTRSAAAAQAEGEDAAMEMKTDAGEQASLVLWVDRSGTVDDQYMRAYLKLAHWRDNRTLFLATTVVCAVTGLLLTVYLCAATGHRRDREGIVLNWFHRVPGDVLLCLMLLGGAGAAALGVELAYDAYGSMPMFIQLLSVGVGVSFAAAMVLGALITVCARCKTRTLLRNTLTWMFCAWCWHKVRQCVRVAGSVAAAVPLIWKAVLVCMAYILFTFWMITSWRYYGSGTLLLWLAVSAAAVLYLLAWAYQWKKIRYGTQEIIGGNPNYHIDTRRMLPDLRGHADELNNLGHAISTAVEDRMRSEHFKAELITNVSHDLKTPLTSIINYVDLLKKADIQDPKAAEYIEVLDRKSQRLKKLTEDLVEASKASTGNLTVTWERLDVGQLTDQALAECGDRLEAQGLTVVRSLPGEPVWVDADGRHLWRVLDNLLTNCAKYALPGTRVYVDLRQCGDWAVLSVKNISRDALDMPAERLMERFVRGDESRNAAGSGLGLSIAQSLTELQHGRFEISIDGDLFKAVVSLPLAGAAPDGLSDLMQYHQ